MNRHSERLGTGRTAGVSTVQPLPEKRAQGSESGPRLLCFMTWTGQVRWVAIQSVPGDLLPITHPETGLAQRACIVSVYRASDDALELEVVPLKRNDRTDAGCERKDFRHSESDDNSIYRHNSSLYSSI